MRILTRYILREFLTPVAYCFLAFASLHLIFELFGEIDKMFQAKPPAIYILKYIFGFLANDLQWLITPSLLLGGLYAMWQLARHSEITAMRASGIGFSTIVAPMLCAALVFSGLTFICSEFYAPKAIYEAEILKNSGFKTDSSLYLSNVPYNNVAGRRDWQIGQFQTKDNSLKDVRITWTDEDGYKSQVLSSQSGVYHDGVWWFQDVTVSKLRPDSHLEDPTKRVPYWTYSRALMVMPELDEQPRDFIVEHTQQGVNPTQEMLSVRDMIRYVEVRPSLATKVRRIWIYEIVNRFVAPLAAFFITLFAVPAGVATGRQSVFSGVVMAILLFIGYYALTLFCGVQAKGGVIPIWLGVAFPNFVILSAGLYLFRKHR